MRLQYQLNLAFTLLLFITLLLTGVIIYSLILNLLIQDEQRQLEQKGELLVNILNEEYLTERQFSHFLEEQDLQLFIYDRRQNQILYSTMSQDISRGFFQYNDFTDDQDTLWEYGNDKFVTSRLLTYPKERGLELILLTPLSDLEMVRQRFFKRLIIVFLLGILAAALISYFLTNKLVTPLSRLKLQLKKIEERQFDQIERVQATGEIKEVEQSVYDMANELQRYIKTQQTFFQNVSHELKTPLMTIQGYAEGIRDRVFTEKESDTGLEVIVQEVKQLKIIINEMILLAKLDSAQETYHPENVELYNIFQQVQARLKPLITERAIEVDLKVLAHELWIDEEKFIRALTNIVTNAIRHADSKIQVSVWKRGNKLFIQIEDDGEGIHEDLMPHIFERFTKGKSGETGLGLAISRTIIEQSGGEIQVSSSPLGGAKFTLTFLQKTYE